MGTQGWRVAVAETIGLGITGAIGLSMPAIAQLNLIPDTAGDRSLGTTIVPVPGVPIDLVAGGTRPENGQNLFHSFQEFNVQLGRGVYFDNPAGVQNIFSRVTGTDRSDILGVLGVAGGNANLFLINPTGTLFGPDASLDVGGSFAATTANAIQFGDQGNFSATNLTNPLPLLTVNPSAFLFTAIDRQPAIVNQSSAQGTTLLRGQPFFGLQVPNRQNLLLLGGNVSSEGGRLSALGGRVEVGSVQESGRVEILPLGALQFPTDLKRGSVTFNSGAVISVNLDNGGVISITSGDIQVGGGSFLVAGIGANLGTATSQAGDLRLNATGMIRVEELSLIANAVLPGASGTAGNLVIEASNLQVTSGATIFSATSGQGNAGNVVLNVQDRILFQGDASVFSTVASGGAGKGGNVLITTGNLEVRDGAFLSASTLGIGDAGNIVINTRNLTLLDAGEILSRAETGSQGEGGNVVVFSSSLEVINDAQVSTSSFGARDAGSIDIQTDSLTFLNGGQFTSVMFGQGNAGNIVVRAQSILVDGGVDNFRSGIFSNVERDGIGNGGTVDVQTNTLTFLNGGQFASATFGQGNAGNTVIRAQSILADGGVDNFRSGIFNNTERDSIGKGGKIDVKANILTFFDGGQFSSTAFGQGDAGDIVVQVQDALQLSNGNISTFSEQTTGGNINITAASIRLFGDSDITTSVFNGIGNGGNITLSANSIIALNDSDILAFARDGRGGNVTLNTRAFFGQNYRPAPLGTDPATLDGNDRVDVNATGIVSGIITLPDVRFIQNNLTQLPNNNIDTNKLLAQTCLIRQDQPEGTFYITGTGGIPNRPNDPALSEYPTNTIQATTQTAQKPWKLGDQIVEPQGFYKLADGQMVMSRECQSPPQNSPH